MHIIAVDDELLALGLLVRSIQEACPSAQISKFQSAHDALQFLATAPCDVAFLDIHMRGIDGLTLAKKIKDLTPQCNLIFVTGYTDSMDMSLNKLQETVEVKGAWCAVVHGFTKIRTQLSD